MKMAAMLNVFLLSLFVSKTATYTQLVNSNTKAVSSSTYLNYVASRTVDGYTDQNVTSCSHTGVRSNITEAWLRIDLGTVYSVKSVTFWNRGDRESAYYNTIRLRGYSLRVSNDTNVPPPESSCYTDPGIVTLPTIIEEDCETTARYIWIYQNKISYYIDTCPILAICEVQVFGCNVGYYGENCSKKCDRCSNNTTCGIENGECDALGCSNNGYQPPLCQPCQNGSYGLNCSKTCGNCLKDTICHHVTGTCLEGCAAGFQPPLCRACNNGTYGHNCQFKCSGNCLREVCDKTDGSCISCVDGHQTDLILLIISACYAIYMLY